MNALQQAMEAIRQAIVVMEIDTPNSDVLDLCYKSLSEGEAELRREPDSFANKPDSDGVYHILPTWTREEIK